MKNQILLVLAVVLVACSTPSAPTVEDAAPPPPVASAVQAPIRLSRRPQPGVVIPPPAVDTRTPAQLAAAACPTGRCIGTGIPKLLMASGQTPIIPPSWTVPNWYVDPANSSGVASDANSGTAATGTPGSGIGPLLTYQELSVHRWDCLGNPVACPRLRQNTTVTFLSSQSSNSDPVYLLPAIENGALVTLSGPALTILATGALASVTAKARASNTFPFKASFGASGAVGQFYSCTHSGTTGYGWLNTLVSGTTFTTSQPLTAQTSFATSGCPTGGTEVDTCVNTDSFTLYNTMPSIDIVRVEPTFTDNNGGFNNLLSIVHLTILGPAGAGNDSVYLGHHVALLESTTQRQVIQTASQLNDDAMSVCLANVNVSGGFTNVANTALRPIPAGSIVGGIMGSPATYNTVVVSFNLFDDILLNGSQGDGAPNGYISGNQISQGLFIPTSTLMFSGENQINSGGVVYGGGTLNAINGRINYPAGAGLAVTTFPIAGLQLDEQGFGCLAVPTAANSFATCNIAVTAANLDANLGATHGCLATGIGASFCNYGP